MPAAHGLRIRQFKSFARYALTEAVRSRKVFVLLFQKGGGVKGAQPLYRRFFLLTFSLRLRNQRKSGYGSDLPESVVTTALLRATLPHNEKIMEKGNK